jgi:hypothetical protein
MVPISLLGKGGNILGSTSTAEFFTIIAIVLFRLAFVGILFLLPACMICKKGGYRTWLGVGVLIPFVNFVLVYLRAFAKWPIERRLGSK